MKVVVPPSMIIDRPGVTIVERQARDGALGGGIGDNTVDEGSALALQAVLAAVVAATAIQLAFDAHGATADTQQMTQLMQLVEIAADGGWRYAQPFGQLVDRSDAFTAQFVDNQLPTVLKVHGPALSYCVWSASVEFGA